MSGLTGSRNSFSIHNFADLPDFADPDLVEVLPVIHAFTRCDTTSKVGRKMWAIKGANNGYELLYYFAMDELSEQETADAESFSSSVPSSMMFTHSMNFFSLYIMKSIYSLS